MFHTINSEMNLASVLRISCVQGNNSLFQNCDSSADWLNFFSLLLRQINIIIHVELSYLFKLILHMIGMQYMYNGEKLGKKYVNALRITATPFCNKKKNENDIED